MVRRLSGLVGDGLVDADRGGSGERMLWYNEDIVVRERELVDYLAGTLLVDPIPTLSMHRCGREVLSEATSHRRRETKTLLEDLGTAGRKINKFQCLLGLAGYF